MGPFPRWGPFQGEAYYKEYLTIIGWDHKRTKTIREKIKEMGIEDIAREIGS
jgi:hypothetical protein